MKALPKNISDLAATISECGSYRYSLRREIQMTFLPEVDVALPKYPRPVVFIMLNPSTADHEIDDQTIRKCITFATRWGYAPLLVVNLFGLRSREPSVLYTHPDPIGPLNDEAVLEVCTWAREYDGVIVCAWGNHGSHGGRDRDILELLDGVPLHCLEVNSTGAPKHPLFARGDIEPIRFKPATCFA